MFRIDFTETSMLFDMHHIIGIVRAKAINTTILKNEIIIFETNDFVSSISIEKQKPK